MNLSAVLAEGANPNTDLLGTWGTIGYIVILGAVFYFLIIRPQKKQRKTHEALVSTVAAGDSVLTSGGFYGVVIDVTDEIVIVEFGSNKNCRIPMKKSAIAEVEKVEESK